MLPAQTRLQNSRCYFHNFGGLRMNWIFIFTFYTINQWNISILTTSFLMSFCYFICYNWYADVLQLLSLQYRCKQYLDELMHGLLLSKSRGLEEEWIKPFRVLFKFALYIWNQGDFFHFSLHHRSIQFMVIYIYIFTIILIFKSMRKYFYSSVVQIHSGNISLSF